MDNLIILINLGGSIFIMNNKFGKYGVIVAVPNYILPYSCSRKNNLNQNY